MTSFANPWMVGPGDIQKFWTDAFEKMAHLPRAMEIAQKARVGTSPAHPIYQEDKLRVLEYETDVERCYETPLVLVFALVNRPYILDLKPGKSVVSHYINRGFPTYMIDWGVPTPGDRHLGMRDYICRYMENAIDKVRERNGVDKVHVLGYCMGGTMSAMYTALNQEKVETLTLLAAPVDWSHRDHLLARWTDKSVFDVERLVEVYGNAPADMLDGSFQMLKPVSNLVEKYFTFYENLDNEKFLEDFFAMEMWLKDNIPVAGEMFRQFVRYCMQENRLIEGRLEIDGRKVNLKNITCPILNLTADKDHLVPCGQSLPFNDAVGSTDRKSVTFSAGHIGMAVGSRAQRELWPKACDWLAERSTSC